MGAEPPVHEFARLVLLTRTKNKGKVAWGQDLHFADQFLHKGKGCAGARSLLLQINFFLLEVSSGCECGGVPISCKMRV